MLGGHAHVPMTPQVSQPILVWYSKNHNLQVFQLMARYLLSVS